MINIYLTYVSGWQPTGSTLLTLDLEVENSTAKKKKTDELTF